QGGQNLSDRYRRLERSVRSKQALQQDLDDYQEEGTGGEEGSAHPSKDGGGLATQQGAPTQTFKGYVIPDEPRPPEADECCMSGCAVCVYDLYEEALQAYKDSLTSIRAGLVQMGVPESQWPERLREKASKAAKVERPIDISRNAFEEMERSLAAKR
ncbi:oxidoreductase-like protein, partial [Schizophyllum commune]